MTVDRRWLWAGGILTIAGGALILGVPLATLITVAAVLACPAAMYFGMGIMGRTQGAGADPSPASERAAPSDNEDPIVILKRRLAAGEIPVEEYERLLAVMSRPGPGRHASPAGQGASR